MTTHILEPTTGPTECPMEMTVERIRELIPPLVSEILETMFFCEAELEAVTAAGETSEHSLEFVDDEDPVYRIVIDFQGSPSGRFWLRVTANAAKSLAADFLGVDRDDVDEARSLQTAFELGNMICGSVVSRVESQAAFALTAPRLFSVGDTLPDVRPPYVSFAVSGGKVEVACSLN